MTERSERMSREIRRLKATEAAALAIAAVLPENIASSWQGVGVYAIDIGLLVALREALGEEAVTAAKRARHGELWHGNPAYPDTNGVHCAGATWMCTVGHGHVCGATEEA